ncbi:MAG TPA: carboxypeptidase-like regulatory domain-containing protein, partial [Polyangia bacterium]
MTLVVSASTEPVILRMHPARSVQLSVVRSADGRPVPGASFELRGAMTVAGVTDETGTATVHGLPPDSYTFVAWADGFAKSFEAAVLTRQGTQPHFEIRLTEGVAVAGQVVDHQSQPAIGALVSFERASSSAFATSAGPDPGRDGVRTDQQGRFEFKALTVGTYRFTAQHDVLGPGSTPPTTIDGRGGQGPIRIVLDGGASLGGRVVSRAGAPVGWAVIKVAPSSPGRMANSVRQCTADERGIFKIGGLPRVPVEVTGQADQGSGHVLVDLGKTPHQTNLVVTLDDDGAIAGVVVNADGVPVPEATVDALPDLERGTAPSSPVQIDAQDIADGGGEFRLTGLAAKGTYRLHAAMPGSSHARHWWADSDMVVAVGETHVKLVVQAASGVKGRVLFEDGTAPTVFYVGVALGPRSPFFGGDGHFVLGDLDPGHVTLVASGPSFAQALLPNVTVDPGRTTDVGAITVTKGRVISGHVLASDGTPVAGASVYAGNRVIGDGETLTTESWGSGSASATKTATSDQNGAFVINGVGARDLALIADHPTAGRSPVVHVPASSDSTSIDLKLVPFGSIQGTVTRNHTPLPGVTVNASPSSLANNSNFVVQTGADGSFRFDRLAADTYVVSAMLGANSLSGVSLNNGVSATVTAGATATANIDLGADPVLITIVPTLPDGSIAALDEIALASGVLQASLSNQVHAYVAALV